MFHLPFSTSPPISFPLESRAHCDLSSHWPRGGGGLIDELPAPWNCCPPFARTCPNSTKRISIGRLPLKQRISRGDGAVGPLRGGGFWSTSSPNEVAPIAFRRSDTLFRRSIPPLPPRRLRHPNVVMLHEYLPGEAENDICPEGAIPPSLWDSR